MSGSRPLTSAETFGSASAGYNVPESEPRWGLEAQEVRVMASCNMRAWVAGARPTPVRIAKRRRRCCAGLGRDRDLVVRSAVRMTRKSVSPPGVPA